MAEAAAWGDAGACVTEARIALRVEDDAVVDAGDSTEGDNLKRSSTFAAVFPALVAARRRRETVRGDGAEIKNLVG